MSVLQRINEVLARFSDAFLALAVIGVLSILVFRVPPAAMDVLLAANMTISVIVLLVALYIPDAVKLPSFPTILLLTTLFRLALNVSTTRLILLEADAGEIINAFGEFVVGGNFIVGGVVFLVITLIQFLVVAKGAERVAEVGARFTLDALPGKQMSIDAELRAGQLDADQAREKRRELERESKLYGAMDGAMKFVKGDAIAGIVIALVNIVGGLVVGVTQMGMTAGEAAQTFTLLTIGDGLVSQIPSILTAVAAGLVVTRVAAAEERPVARDIIDQVTRQPRALGLTALMCLGLALVPGFPAAVFLVLAGVCGVGALAASRSRDAERLASMTAGPASGEPSQPAETGFAPLPIVLSIHQSLEPLLAPQDEAAARQVRSTLSAVRASVSGELGLPLPTIRIGVGDPKLPTFGYAINLYDGPVATGQFAPVQALVLAPVEQASAAGLDATPATVPWRRASCASIPVAQAEAAQRAGLPVLSPAQVILAHLRSSLRRHASAFLGVQEASQLIDGLKQQSPDLVKAVCPVHLTTQQVTDVLQRLLREQTPIRDLRAIFDALARWAQTTKNPAILTERVRRDLARPICARFCATPGRMRYLAVDPAVEALVAGNTVETAEGPVVALSYADQKRVVDAVRRAVETADASEEDHVVLVSPAVRRPIRSLLEHDAPEVAVLSFDELAPELMLERRGIVLLDAP